MNSIFSRFLLTVFFLLPLTLFAAAPFDFGLVGSYTFPFYTGSGYEDYLSDLQDESGADEVSNNPIVGFTLGGTAEYGISSWFSLQGELLLAGCGGGYVFEEEGSRSSTIISEINLQLPVMAKFSRPLSGGRSFYAMAGPQLSLLLYDSEHDQSGEEFSSRHEGLDEFYAVSIGMLMALGWQAPVGRTHVFLELRYARDFSSSLHGAGYNVQNIAGIAAGLKFKNGRMAR